MPTIYLHFIPHLILSNSGKWWLVGIESHHKSAATKVAAPPPENQELHLLPADFSRKIYKYNFNHFWVHPTFLILRSSVLETSRSLSCLGAALEIFLSPISREFAWSSKKKQILWEILKIGSLEEVWEQTQNHTLELNFSYDTIPHHIFVKGLVRREIMVNIFWSFLKQIECEAKMHPTTNWNVTVCSHSFVGNLIENYFYS